VSDAPKSPPAAPAVGETLTTHLGIDQGLCGAPVELGPGRAVVELPCAAAMGVDAEGLVHGGFVFGLADHAAMLAVNHPHVVLGSADTRFVAPVRVGAVVRAEARRVAEKGRKHTIEVQCAVEGALVMTGTFTAFVLDHHVLQG